MQTQPEAKDGAKRATVSVAMAVWGGVGGCFGHANYEGSLVVEKNDPSTFDKHIQALLCIQLRFLSQDV